MPDVTVQKMPGGDMRSRKDLMFNIIQAQQGAAITKMCPCPTFSEKELLYNILLNTTGGSGLPDMGAHAGEFLTNDGTDASWVPLAGGGDVVASGTLTLDKLMIGQGGTTIKATPTGTGVLTALGVNIGSAGAVVLFNGAGGTPTSITLTGGTGLPLTSGVTGDLPFANLAQGAALSVLGVTGNAIADVASIAAGTDHQVLRRSGTAVAFGAVNLAQAAAITGTLPVGNGGTGQTSFTDGQLLIGNTAGNTLTKATLTAGTNITITNGNGSITIDAAGGGGGIAGSTGATDNAILRADGAGGATLQSSVVTIGDTGLITDTIGAANVGLLASTGYSLTGSNATSMIDLAGTWNTTGAPTLFKANVTNIASGGASLLMDLQIDSTSKFRVTKSGDAIARFFQGTDGIQGADVISTAQFVGPGQNFNITGGGDAVMKIDWANGPGAIRVAFCGVTSAFPSLKRSSATLQCRLGDDSDYATFHAKTYSVDGTAGAAGGTFTTITSITVKNGIVTAIAGS